MIAPRHVKLPEYTWWCQVAVKWNTVPAGCGPGDAVPSREAIGRHGPEPRGGHIDQCIARADPSG